MTKTYPGAGPAVSEAKKSARSNLIRYTLVYAALFAATLGLALRSGMLRSEFGRYQDEGMHYVTGLFVQDFLTSGQWSHPIHFAQQYYLHLPKIALGQWPPGFSVMQSAWGLIFGVSRVSMLFGMIALTAWLAFLVYRSGERYFGTLWGMLGAVLLIAAPLTQEQTAMVMAEIPLTAASFLAITAFVRFLESRLTRDAIAFALWTSAAIMIKGNGWVIGLAAPLILVVAGKFRLLLNPRLWLSAFLIGVLCVPYTLITMHIVTQGWDTQSFPGLAYAWASLGIHLGFVAHLLGIPLTVLAVIGGVVSIYRRFTASSEQDPFWIAMVCYGIAIVVFHVAIPSSIEPRKIYQIAPVVCLLALAGLDAIATLLIGWKPAASPRIRVAVAGVGALLFLLSGFSLLPEYSPGFVNAVENVIARPETRGSAVLISSNPQWTDSEAAVIAEWAARRRNDGTFLIRGTKLLSHQIPAGPNQVEFQSNFATGDELLKALSAIPISFVILDTTEARISYPHHALLKTALAGDPSGWELVSHTSRYVPAESRTHDVDVYRCRRDLAGVPIHYSVDLTRKVGAQITTGP